MNRISEMAIQADAAVEKEKKENADRQKRFENRLIAVSIAIMIIALFAAAST